MSDHLFKLVSSTNLVHLEMTILQAYFSTSFDDKKDILNYFLNIYRNIDIINK